MHIRIATRQDREEIRGIHLDAFSEDEREVVSTLAVNLIAEETTPQTLSLVAESDGAVVGHVAFSPASIDNNDQMQGYILAPIGVKPDYQKRRIGSKLIEHGMQQLTKAGVNILFVYGDPEYYQRFGFSTRAAEEYIPPYALEYPFGWQAITLNDCKMKRTPARIICVSPLCDPILW